MPGLTRQGSGLAETKKAVERSDGQGVLGITDGLPFLRLAARQELTDTTEPERHHDVSYPLGNYPRRTASCLDRPIYQYG